MDETDKPQQTVVGTDENCLVPPPEKLSLAAMPAVETLGVHTVDMAHTSGDIGIVGLNEQMIVVGHQAVGGYAQVPHLRRFDQYLDESLIVDFVEKDLFRSATPVHDMIPSIRVFDSQWTKNKGKVNTISNKS
jgi:hypothetical protein